MKDNRYIGALTLIPLFLCFIAGGVYLEVAVSLLALRALYEFYTVVKLKNVKTVDNVGYIFAALFYLLLFIKYDDYRLFFVLTLLLTSIVLIITVFKRDHGFIDASVTVLGFLYAAMMFSPIIFISRLENGYWYIFTIFTVSWISDTMAYFTGRAFGKRKLIPEVSPKKTVEGAIGGLLGGALGTLIYGFILTKNNIQVMPLYHFFIMGLIASVFGIIGDLIASAIKREVSAKDYPKLIPGHGGILDRFDSFILVALFVYFYLLFITPLF